MNSGYFKSAHFLDDTFFHIPCVDSFAAMQPIPGVKFSISMSFLVSISALSKNNHYEQKY